jgi:hypothetical protein
MTSAYKMEMILRSKRAYQDLSLALDHKDRFNENVVIRERTDINPGMEFRCFVFEGKLTAITQYSYQVIFPQVLANKSVIEQRLLKGNEQVSELMNSSDPLSYVIDFGITSNEKWLDCFPGEIANAWTL